MTPPLPPFLKNATTASDGRGAFSFIFLSLMLLILCFFIKMISVSDFEQIKIDAVATSVQSAFKPTRNTFSFFRPTFIPAGSVLQAQELFTQSFDKALIHQRGNGRVLEVALPTQEIFVPYQDNLTPKAKLFLKKSVDVLQTKSSDSFEVGLTQFIDLPTDGTYPVYSHLASRRVQKVVEYLLSLNVPERFIQVGFQKGNAETVLLSLTFDMQEELDDHHLPQ